MKPLISKEFVWLLVVASLASFSLTSANAFPPVATEFYGTAVLNATNATAGINVTVVDPDNVTCGSFTIVNEGYYGSLSCRGDDPSTSVDEGGVENDAIKFYINGTLSFVFGNTSWHEAVFQNVNISTANQAPFFLHPLTPQIVNESTRLIYDINCSDQNPDEILTFHDNTSLFDIDPSSGIVSWIPYDEHVGNHSINITCSDSQLNVSDILNITVLNINNAPTLFQIGPKVLVENVPFSLAIFANDSDTNDSLSFFAVTTLFTILTVNSSPAQAKGTINFTPIFDQIGNHTINISVTDGNLTDFEIVSFTIVRGPFCGDLSCSIEEDCTTCEVDCGVCPEIPPGEETEQPGTGGGGGGGGRAAAATTIEDLFAACNERWQCSDWGVCQVDNVQTRDCVDINKCGTAKNKPPDVRSCVYVPTCFDGVKNGEETGLDCGGPCQPCLRASCFDGIQNQGETGVDCGGPCNECIIDLPDVPFAEEIARLAPILRTFPWILLIILSIVSGFTVSGDYSYLHHITKLKLEEFRKRMKKYRPIRRRMYQVLATYAVMTIIASLYIYIFSNNIATMIRNAWIPLLLMVLSPIGVSVAMRHLRYYEYKRKRKEKLLEYTHRRQIMELMRIEDNLLYDLGKKVRVRAFASMTKGAFNPYPKFYAYIRLLYKDLATLEKLYKEKFGLYKTDQRILQEISVLTTNDHLRETAKSYPEFQLLCDGLDNVYDRGLLIDEEELMFAIREVSQPQIKTVVLASQQLPSLYNKLVDIHTYFEQKHALLEHKDKELIDEAKLFTKRVHDLAKQTLLVDKVRKNAPVVWVYNRLIELFDHYTEKISLNQGMKDKKIK